MMANFGHPKNTESGSPESVCFGDFFGLQTWKSTWSDTNHPGCLAIPWKPTTFISRGKKTIFLRSLKPSCFMVLSPKVYTSVSNLYVTLFTKPTNPFFPLKSYLPKISLVKKKRFHKGETEEARFVENNAVFLRSKTTRDVIYGNPRNLRPPEMAICLLKAYPPGKAMLVSVSGMVFEGKKTSCAFFRPLLTNPDGNDLPGILKKKRKWNI